MVQAVSVIWLFIFYLYPLMISRDSTSFIFQNDMGRLAKTTAKKIFQTAFFGLMLLFFFPRVPTKSLQKKMAFGSVTRATCRVLFLLLLSFTAATRVQLLFSESMIFGAVNNILTLV